MGNAAFRSIWVPGLRALGLAYGAGDFQQWMELVSRWLAHIGNHGRCAYFSIRLQRVHSRPNYRLTGEVVYPIGLRTGCIFIDSERKTRVCVSWVSTLVERV